MRRMNLAWFPAVLLFTGVAFGQITLPNHLPFKDLIFPQVAAGGNYQTWITVTNRGTYTWRGTFYFYQREGLAWNPYVNDVQVSKGALAITLPAGVTRTYKITLPVQVTETGFFIARAYDTNLDNFLQGNLTYYVGTGQVDDSVGIMPSIPFYASTIPFEDFSTICFAFANTDSQGRDTSVRFNLYTNTNTPAGTYTLPLTNMQHVATYLWQMFGQVDLGFGRGRVEIESDVPISGVALIQGTSQQYSSLPLGPTARTYNVDTVGLAINFARFTLWPEGLYVNGYTEVQREQTYDLFGLFGQIRDGKLLLHFDGNGAATSYYDIFGFLRFDGNYTPGQPTVSGAYWVASTTEYWVDEGTFTATLVP